MLRLVVPSLDYEKQINEYRARSLAADGRMHGTAGLAQLTVPQWLELLRSKASPQTCPPGLVPDSTFLCVRERDNAVVGMINIRHVLTDWLYNFGGHIGYSIHPDERGKGYAKEQLRLGLMECGRLGIGPALVTCEENNERSRRTILWAGGVYEDTREEPGGKRVERYWIPVS